MKLESLRKVLEGYDKFNKNKILSIKTCYTETKYGYHSLLYYINIDYDGTIYMREHRIYNNKIEIAFCGSHKKDTLYPITDQQLDTMYKIVELINNMGIKTKILFSHINFNN